MSGVVTLFWLIAAVMLAQMIDTYLSRMPLAASLPQAIIGSVSVLGALVGSAVRTTMLNRRSIWLAHGLGGVVVAHEIWRGSDPRHRARSLAAVDVIAEFVGSPAAQVLTLAPWAIATIAGLWSLHADLAAVTSAVLLLQCAFALIGSRISPRARQFDAEVQARATGADAIPDVRGESVSMDRARAVAERWEATQALRFGAAYCELQRRSRREALLMALDLSAASALLLALAYAAPNGLSIGSLAALGLVALASIHVVSRVVLEAPSYARVRAARRQLSTLRVAKSRQGFASAPVIVAPRMRGPIAAGFLTTMATAAAIAFTAVAWQMPAAMAARDAISLLVPAALSQSSMPEPPADRRNRQASTADEPSGPSKTKAVPKGRS